MTASASRPRSSRPQAPPPRTRHSVVLAAVIALVAAVLVPVGAGVPAAEAAIPTTLPTDLSGQLPITERGEAVGDFMGRGYAQRGVIETNLGGAQPSNLNVYDPEERGGALLRSTPAPYYPWITPYTFQYNVVDYWDDYVGGRETVPMVWTPEGLYIGGFIIGQPSSTFVMRTRNDGTCTQPSCATGTGDWVNRSFPALFPNAGDPYNSSALNRNVIVSSLAAGMIGTTPVLAVGLSDTGVRILNRNTGQQIGQAYGGCATGGIKTQTPPTALAWDPSGSGWLAVGCMSPQKRLFTVQYAANGTVLATGQYSDLPPDVPYNASPGFEDWNAQPLSAAVLRRPTDPASTDPLMAFGMSNGTVLLLNPRGTSNQPVASFQASAPVTGLTTVPRVDGTTGFPDLVVAYGSTVPGVAQLVRYGGTSSLTALPVDSTGATSTDAGGIRQVFPGYRTGRFEIVNSAAEPVSVELLSRPEPGYGCWFAPAFADGSGARFPGEVDLTAGQTSNRYVLGGATLGTAAGCAPTTDSTSEWAAYLVVTPAEDDEFDVKDDADRQVVKLQIDRDSLQLDVSQQVGGSLTVTAAPDPSDSNAGALGAWTLTIDGAEPPQVDSAPTITGRRLTAAGDPGPTVYRVDVSGATYTMDTDPAPRVQATVPPLLVEGYVDSAAAWQPLGQLVPRTPLNLSSDGSTLTLGNASFWWQNDPDDPDAGVSRVRVVTQDSAGGTAPSTELDLTALAVPAALNLTGPVVAPTAANRVASPATSGLDQASLKVQVQDLTPKTLPSTDPSYGRIYYRENVDGTSDDPLVTNLYLTDDQGDVVDPTSFIGVSLYAGVYSSSTRPGSATPTTHYVSTTSDELQSLAAYVGGVTSDQGPTPSQPITVQAVDLPTEPAATSAAQGISIVGCSDYTGVSTCRLAGLTATRPALYEDYDADGQPLIGVLTASPATTSEASLPLQQKQGLAEHQLASAPLTVGSNSARLVDTSAFFGGDSVDTALVTHGILVAVEGVPVSG